MEKKMANRTKHWLIDVDRSTNPNKKANIFLCLRCTAILLEDLAIIRQKTLSTLGYSPFENNTSIIALEDMDG